MRKIDFINREFALADPVPLTLAIFMVNSLTLDPALMTGYLLKKIEIINRATMVLWVLP